MQVYSVPKSKPKLPPVPVVRTVNGIRSRVAKMQNKMVPPPVHLLELISSMWTAQAICAAARLGVADYMSSEPYAAKDIAKKVGANADATYRLLRALTTVGLFVETDNKQFALTTLGECLRTDHPLSMRHMAIFQGEHNWSNWGDLTACVKTGKNAVERIHGMKGFDFLARNPHVAKDFNQAMTNISKMELDSILATYDFSTCKTIADIGGGHGAFLASVLSLYPQTKGILFDLPEVVKGSRACFKEHGLTKRCKIAEGSFFETIPEGADTYVMKHILHDWSDAECKTILKNIRKSIPEQGRLLVVETLVTAPNTQHFSKWLDLEMLVVTTGKERTEAEFAALFADCGFALKRVVPTISMANIMEAKAV